MSMLDELAVPTPPYRRARPIASLASEVVEAPPSEASVEVPPATAEQITEEAARKEADAADAVRDQQKESSDSVLQTLGGELAAAAAAVHEMVSPVAAPSEAAEPVAPVTPVEQSTGYKVPEQTQLELDRLLAKQAALREAGDEKGAKEWDKSIQQYQNSIRQHQEQFDATKNSAEANRLVEELEALTKSSRSDARKANTLARNRNSQEAPASFRDSANQKFNEARAAEERVRALMDKLTPDERAVLLKKIEGAWDGARPTGGDQRMRREYKKQVDQAYDEATAVGNAVNAPAAPATPEAPSPEAGDLQAEPAPSLQAEPAPQLQAEPVEEPEQEMLRRAAENPAPEDLPRPLPSVESVIRRMRTEQAYTEDVQEAARGEAQRAEIARRRSDRAPQPEQRVAPQPENPSREIREMRARRKEEQPGGILSSAVEWVSRKTGARAWLDTVVPRLKSVYHRQFAERRAWHQEKAHGSLARATEKRDEFNDKLADSSWALSRKYYAWRAQSWEKAILKREALVNKHDSYRVKRVERHNELQRQVAERYERELAPYRGKKEALERDQKATIKTIESLDKIHKAALKELETAEGKRSGRLGRRGKAAADKIRRQVLEIEGRISAQRDRLNKEISKPLAEASAKIEKYESRQRGVAVAMRFSEMDGLETVRRAKPGPLPERKPFNSYAEEVASEPAVESVDARSTEEWTPAEFVESWNGNGLVRIEDPAAFEQFVTAQRAADGEDGPIQLGRMLALTESYLKDHQQSKKGFTKDRRFFLASVSKSASA